MNFLKLPNLILALFIFEEKCQNYDKCRFHDPASFVKLVHPDFKMKFLSEVREEANYF